VSPGNSVNPMVQSPSTAYGLKFLHGLITSIGFMSAFVPGGFQFVFLQMIAGIVAVVGVKNLHRRGQVFITSLLIFLSYVFVYFVLLLLEKQYLTAVIQYY
jgi:hypothetical protein